MPLPQLARSLAAGMLLAAATVAPASAQSAADEREAVLAVNEEFYRAFRESDMEAMRNVWGAEEPVGLQHPAWPSAITGRSQVLQSWIRILRSPPDISCEVESMFQSEGSWAVVCLEILNPGSVRMINLFRRDGDDWKMVYHGRAPEGRGI